MGQTGYTFNFLSFNEWKKANPDLTDEKGNCDHCGGSGVHHCDCGDIHDCGFCDNGKVVINSLWDMYQGQLRRDQERLNAWIADDVEREVKVG